MGINIVVVFTGETAECLGLRIEDRESVIGSYPQHTLDSFGMKKKVQIIAAVLSNAPYVLGDEVFNGLDFETTLITVKLFQALLDHRSFVLISHNMTIINHFCDHIFLMSNGKLVPFTGDASQLEAEVLRTESVHDKITFIQRYATFDDNVSE